MCGMRDAGDIDAFVAAPIGAFVRGPCYLAWCLRADLLGIVLWGSPSPPATDDALRLLELDRAPALHPPYDVISDGSRLTGVDPVAYGRLARAVMSRLPRFHRRVRRHALVAQPGLYGAVVAGFFPMLGAQHAYRSFKTAREAFRWVDAAQDCDLVETLVADHLRRPRLLDRLHGAIEREIHDPRLERVARVLGTSERTLQRMLAEAGTSFRSEVHRVRTQLARALLLGPDRAEKVETIARTVGFSSVSHFVAAFRRAVGQTPDQFRRTHLPVRQRSR